ncbi:MAG: hypothetical protein M3417_01680 [Actinomycetota bacterium]|nr:hypothetical protein [Actinomycetota bacterium]
MPELPWYAELREAHRPERVRVLLIGESAPDPGAAERRFFYAPVLDRRDNLYRGVVEAFYGCFPGRAGDPKATWLNRLEGDGVFLIDLVPFPVNGLSPDKAEARRLRASARRNHVAACVEHARHLDPEGVIVCHGPSFDVLAPPMRAAGLPVLHEKAIPFPLGNWRARFVTEVRRALEQLPTQLPSAGRDDR